MESLGRIPLEIRLTDCPSREVFTYTAAVGFEWKGLLLRNSLEINFCNVFYLHILLWSVDKTSYEMTFFSQVTLHLFRTVKLQVKQKCADRISVALFLLLFNNPMFEDDQDIVPGISGFQVFLNPYTKQIKKNIFSFHNAKGQAVFQTSFNSKETTAKERLEFSGDHCIFGRHHLDNTIRSSTAVKIGWKSGYTKVR